MSKNICSTAAWRQRLYSAPQPTKVPACPRVISSYEIFPAPRGGGYVVALFDQDGEIIRYSGRTYPNESEAKEYGLSVVRWCVPDSQEDENVEEG